MIKTFLVLYPFKFRSFDEKRFEFDLFNKNRNKIVIYEFLNILNPHFKKAYKIEKRKKDLLEVNSIFHFYAIFKKFSLLNNNFIIFNFLKNDSFKSILIKFIIKFFNVKKVSFFNPGISIFDKGITTSNLKLYKKILFLVKRPYETLSKLKGKFLELISSILKIDDDYIFVAGEECLKNIKRKNSKIIKGHSWDISNIYSRKTKKIIKNKYAVYLDAPGPKFLSDSFLLGEKNYETCTHTYPLLQNFFKQIEKKYNLNVVISPHPKTYIKDYSSLFGYRRVISGHTQDLIKNCEFIITRNSTAVSYACYYKKSILLFYTNETINTEAQRTTILLAQSLNCTAVNLDDIVHNKKKFILKKNLNKYKQYLTKYCTFEKIKIPNYQIWKNFDYEK